MDRRKFLVQGGRTVALLGAVGPLSEAQQQTENQAVASNTPSTGDTLAIRKHAYVPYTDAVETKQADEDEISNQIASTMLDISRKVGQRQRHTVRSVHAKSHGLLKAEFVVLPGLEEHLRQGLFADAKSYGAVMRFSTNPGDILSDHISTPRGLALKVIGVEGEMLPSHAGQVTQDFVFNNSSTFHSPNGKDFLKGITLLDKHANDTEASKQLVSSVAQTVEEGLELLGQKSPLLKGFGSAPVHPLGETYHTAVPIRFGDYFGKLHLVPVSSNMIALKGKHVEHPTTWNAVKDSLLSFFAHETAVWELRVQLCTDLEKMPVEDASVEWPESLSPSLPIARITAQAQNAYSDARRVFVDEQLTFNPWQALAAHRPLGNIMRARFQSYKASSEYRHRVEGRVMVEPKSIEELPA